MIYSTTGKYCIFSAQDYIDFREVRHLSDFKVFLMSNDALCADDVTDIFNEFKSIDETFTHGFTDFNYSTDSDQYYLCNAAWYYCFCKNPGKKDLKKLYSLTQNGTTVIEQSVKEDTSVTEQSVKEDITCVKPNDDKGGCTMASVNESFKTVLSMKMLKGIMKGGDGDLGKLFLMQQMTNGQPLQVSDVVKSKLINEFSLDKDGDMPLEKVLLLQMLDGGSIDMNQLIMFKMMGSLFDEDSDKKKE